MAKEIERKFLVSGNGWRTDAAPSKSLRQAYLASTDAASVRVRIVDGEGAWITVKSASAGPSRDEFEYPVPVADAEAMLALRTGEIIEKVRYELPCDEGDLTVDAFSGSNAGLVIAEIELPSEHADPLLPDWVGAEITHDRRYYNASLAEAPYASWADGDPT